RSSSFFVSGEGPSARVQADAARRLSQATNSLAKKIHCDMTVSFRGQRGLQQGLAGAGSNGEQRRDDSPVSRVRAFLLTGRTTPRLHCRYNSATRSAAAPGPRIEPVPPRTTPAPGSAPTPSPQAGLR